MATKRQKKKAYNTTKKIAKKYPILIVVVLVILIGLGVTAFVLYNNGYFDKWFSKNDNQNSGEVTHSEDGYNENIIYDDFQVHFMELGNDKAGDSIYIKAGENDILIDAGSTTESASTTVPYMQKYVKDNKLEFVIATHGDKDHIAAFPNILKTFDAGIIIRNELSNKSSNAGYVKMQDAFDKEVSDNNAKLYYAGQCFNNEGGAKNSYQLADNIKMDIIYNYYYWNTSSDENNYSVCVMFTYNDNHFFFTGDLEKEGEEKLAEYYDGSTTEKTLPHVDLYKAGHHGSKTSSNECLLKKIQPKMCVACCCAGTDEYTDNLEHQFPTQAFINRIAEYTDRVYVPTTIKLVDGTLKNVSMNGNIIISANGVSVGLSASNNLTKLKDSEWFNEEIYAVETGASYTWNEKGDKFKVHKKVDEGTSGAVLMPNRTWPAKA